MKIVVKAAKKIITEDIVMKKVLLPILSIVMPKIGLATAEIR